MKKWLILVVVSLVLGSMLVGLAGDAAGQTKTTAVVRRGDLVARVSAAGNLSLPHQVDLNFGTSGTLKEIKVARGDRVIKGQELARLDDTSFQDAVKRQTLQFLQDEKTLEAAQLDLMRAAEQLEEAAPKSGQSYTYYTDVVLIRTNINLALEKIDQGVDYMKTGDISLADNELSYARKYLGTALDAANTTQFIAIDRTRSVADTISAIRQLTYLKEKAQVAARKAQIVLDTTRFSLEVAKKDLAKTILLAPYDGIISDIARLDEGSSVTTSTRILHIVNTSRVEMNGLMIELDVAGVRTGQEALVTVDALPNMELKGKVTFVSPTASTTSGVVSYPVTITLEPQAEIVLKDGMTASASILIGQRTNVLLIPVLAVSNSGGRERTVEVVVDQRSGRTEQRRVTVGLSDGERIEVISGLNDGEIVVVK